MSLKEMDNRSERTRSGKSVKSSTGSRASINVTLPSTSIEALNRHSPVQVRGISPDRQCPTAQKHRIEPSPHLSSGTVPPQGTPTGAEHRLSDKELTRLLSVRIIERAWLSFRDKQMFKLLKHSVCAAEHSLSTEILRKVCPKEAELLQDKCMRCKVRFRFGGGEFPPLIFFKVFSSTVNGMGVRYVSGRKMIQPASNAARDACDLMGARQFYGQVIQDRVQYEQRGVTDETDVTTLKDYMQYLSFLDETPAYMGGKENSWRQLTLEVLPRQTIFYDVVEFLYSQKLTDELAEELPRLLIKPNNTEVQLAHMDIISRIRSPHPLPPTAPVYHSKAMAAITPGQQTGRRSQQARQRIRKMRHLYESEKVDTSQNRLSEADQKRTSRLSQSNDFFLTEPTDYINTHDGMQGISEDELDQEAQKLYEWTQELSLDEIAATPRIPVS